MLFLFCLLFVRLNMNEFSLFLVDTVVFVVVRLLPLGVKHLDLFKLLVVLANPVVVLNSFPF